MKKKTLYTDEIAAFRRSGYIVVLQKKKSLYDQVLLIET